MRIADITGKSLRWLLHGEEEVGATYADLAAMAEQQRALTAAMAELTDAIRDLRAQVGPAVTSADREPGA